MLFNGKVVIVTGAGNGLGRSHALAFAKEGARVVVNDVGGDRSGKGGALAAADQVVAEITAAGGQAVANYDSVASVEGADRILWSALAKWGRIDVLVNNAGILRDKTIVNTSRDELDAVLDVHLRGTFFCMQAVARQMKVQGSGGRIINTSSLSGLIGNFGQGNYAAAKAGIYGLTRVAALELQKLAITVNAIAPVALTRMTEDLPRINDLGDIGPEKVTPMVLFLASEQARDVTGRVFGCQGGRFFEYWMEQNEGWQRAGAPATVAEIAENFRAIARP
jgi:NAD(P)-dependent dehydrogenase (short-subunit alcohol dehydrogenase family)